MDFLGIPIRPNPELDRDLIALTYRKQYGGPEHVYAVFELHPDTHPAADEHADTDAHKPA